MPIRLRKRHRLRKKEIRALSEHLEEILSITCFSVDDIVDRASLEKYDVIIVNGEILGLIYKDEPFLTVKGLLKFRPEKRYVTVDMGAVRYVYNGADIMAPGIVNAYMQIVKGDIIWVRDEKNHQPLAVGESLMSGEDLIESTKGKGVISIHHVGDHLWNYEN
jgi:PUA domain protein